MTLHIITLNGSPSKKSTLYRVERREAMLLNLSDEQRNAPVIAWSAENCIKVYRDIFGIAWNERAKGVEVKRLVLKDAEVQS